MAAPYYSDDHVTIYHSDCREVLPSLGQFDAVVTDPPYGINDAPLDRPGGRDGNLNTWHPPSDWDHSIDPEWCAMACTAAPLVAWFGHWRKRHEVEQAMTYPIRAEVIWAKDRHVGPPCPFGMRDERIWLFSETGITPRRFDTTVWDVPGIASWDYKHHKNQKPIALMLRLLQWLPGDSIVDPFMGSGSTLRAAKDLGRRAIGVEIDERYCEIAATRMGQEVLDFGGAA